MIQRIQSVWLFLASMFNGLLFICPLYKFNYPQGGMIPSPWQEEGVRNYMPLLILAAIITPSPDWTSQLIVGIPLVFLYEISIFISARVDRQRQLEEKQWE